MFEMRNTRKAYCIGDMRQCYVRQKPIGYVGRLCDIEVFNGFLESIRWDSEIAI